jgi:hypothetical protein
MPFPVTVSEGEPELLDEELEPADEEAELLDEEPVVEVEEGVASGSPSEPETKEQACSTSPASRHCRKVRSGGFISSTLRLRRRCLKLAVRPPLPTWGTRT